MTFSSSEQAKRVLLVGASRGLGEAMAVDFVAKGWRVVGTVRQPGGTGLHDLAETHADQVEIERLDITERDQIAGLRERLSGGRFDMLFVNAGVATSNPIETIGQVSNDAFVSVMLTNVLGVMRAVEAFQDLVSPEGVIGVMSSGQGSITRNIRGGVDAYRASKAALNQCMRSYAARHADDQRAMVLMAPGWIRTELGGPNGTFSIEETIPHVVQTLIAQQGTAGLRFIDRFGETLPW